MKHNEKTMVDQGIQTESPQMMHHVSMQNQQVSTPSDSSFLQVQSRASSNSVNKKVRYGPSKTETKPVEEFEKKKLSFVASDFSSQSCSSSSESGTSNIIEKETCQGLKIQPINRKRKLGPKAGTVDLGEIKGFQKKEISIGFLQKKTTFMSRNKNTIPNTMSLQSLPTSTMQMNMLPKIEERESSPSRIKLSPMAKDIIK